MSISRHISAVALLSVLASGGTGMMPPHDFSDKTVTELIILLSNTDPRVRTDAAICLGYRYRKPGPVINPATYKTQNPELPLPPDVVPSLAKCVEGDEDKVVRIAAIDALRDLRFQTNTTPVLLAGLSDKDGFVRLRTCLAFIDISHEYPDPLPERVIAVLRDSLQPQGDVESTWYAAWIAGQMGRAGEPLIPALQETTKHESSKVQHYAREALSKIDHQDKHAR